jgi:3-dehydroquinate synthase
MRDGERYKNFRTYTTVVDQLVEKPADRQTVLLALGGGVTGDLAGFVAATYMRGLDLVLIPSSLVAQIDASIGGKTAVDLPVAKNTIGVFYQPRLVLTDPEVLQTLPAAELRNGLCEGMKTALVTDRGFFTFMTKNLAALIKGEPRLLARLVRSGAQAKARIIRRDPFDRGRRAILNFGHTVGHALETAARYRRLGHGVAVGRGMLVALRLSRQLGLHRWPDDHEVFTSIQHLLPHYKWERFDPEQLWQTMQLDKKTERGAVCFVLLKDIGRPVIRSVRKSQFMRAWRDG